MSNFVIERNRLLTMVFTAFRRGGSADELSDRIDLTGYKLRFAMKLNAVDDAFSLKKNDTGNPGDVVMSAQSGSTIGQYTVFVRPADTVALTHDEYVFDATVVSATSDPSTVDSGRIALRREIDDLV